MGIKRRAPKIKGTTRVSFCDRQLIKRLWIADRNSKQAKQKRSREINRNDKKRLSETPNRKSREAFAHILKNVRGHTSKFTMADTDDRSVVCALCSPQWSEIERRYENLDTEVEWIRKMTKDDSASKLLKLVQFAFVTKSRSLPMIEDRRKYKRMSNHRAREEKYNRMLYSQLPKRRRQRTRLERDITNGKRSKIVSEGMIKRTNLCDTLNGADSERDALLWYTCYICLEPVHSCDMGYVEVEKDDVVHFHVECRAKRSKNQLSTIESKRKLLTDTTFL